MWDSRSNINNSVISRSFFFSCEHRRRAGEKRVAAVFLVPRRAEKRAWVRGWLTRRLVLKYFTRSSANENGKNLHASSDIRVVLSFDKSLEMNRSLNYHMTTYITRLLHIQSCYTFMYDLWTLGERQNLPDQCVSTPQRWDRNFQHR